MSNPPGGSTEKVTACLSLADFWARRFDARRAYEWKVTLGVWAALLGSVAVIKDLHLALWQAIVVGAIAAFLGFVYALLWLQGLWLAHHNDKAKMLHFATEAAHLLSDPRREIPPPPEYVAQLSKELRKQCFGSWSILFQLSVTILLLALILSLVLRRRYADGGDASKPQHDNQVALEAARWLQ